MGTGTRKSNTHKQTVTTILSLDAQDLSSGNYNNKLNQRLEESTKTQNTYRVVNKSRIFMNYILKVV